MRPGHSYGAIWVLDFEFGTQPSLRPEPVCMVAHDIVSGRIHHIWKDEFGCCPFETGPDVLFVAYYASAELGCFHALGWPIPERILDLYAEYRAFQNGNTQVLGFGLLAAAKAFGISTMASDHKNLMRDLILSGGPWSSEERQGILNYCEADVAVTAQLLEVMWPFIAATPVSLGQALFRGRYMAAVAAMEWNGVPLDQDILERLHTNWTEIKAQLVSRVDASYGVYDGTRFVRAKFEQFVERRSFIWPRLPSGALKLDKDTWKEMAQLHPELELLRELQVVMGQFRQLKITCGADGRNRTMLSPFRSKTGRNQPSNSKFIFGAPSWLRSLIKPEPGYGLAYCDFSSQEIAIAAALSGDTELWAAYASGDPYTSFAIQAGLAPDGATKATHKAVRDRCKAIVLGVGYGMSAQGMAQRAGIHITEAQELLLRHRNTYRVFWAWVENIQNHGMMGESLSTPLGWKIRLRGPRDINDRSLLNWPMQSAGSDMMRLASCLLVEAGVEVCAPVHDALLVRFPLVDEDRVADLTTRLMGDASEAVMGDGYRCRVDADIVHYPNRYEDERGSRMWAIVMELLGEVENES